MNQKPRKLYCVKQPQWYLSGKLAFRRKHKCDHECMALVNQILADKPEKFYLVKGVPGVLSTHHSSYLVPLQLGFGRVLNPTGLCHYQAPCGRTLNTYAEIFAYLKKTKSRMAVDQFVLDPCVPLFRAHSPLKVWYYLPDMSRGKETLSIQAVNQHTTQQLPDFEYIPEMKFDLGLNSIDRISSVFERDKVCCDCEDDCEDAQHCPCRAKCKYGYDFMRLEKHSPYVIYECGSECKCRSSCLNRVVQHGVRVRLQVFRTGRSGWSVRCLQDLVKGTFVCVFAGHVHELKQWEQLDREATYALDLNLKDFQQVDQEVQQLFEQHMAKLNSKNESDPNDSSSSECLSDVSSLSDLESSSDMTEDSDSGAESNDLMQAQDDATEAGPTESDEKSNESNSYVCDGLLASNVSRFLSYSCNPNLISQHVLLHSNDGQRVPAVAFFTSKHVKSFFELTWDYGKPHCPKLFGFRCKCRSMKCCCNQLSEPR